MVYATQLVTTNINDSKLLGTIQFNSKGVIFYLFRMKGENMKVLPVCDLAKCWIYVFNNEGEGYNDNEIEMTWINKQTNKTPFWGRGKIFKL